MAGDEDAGGEEADVEGAAAGGELAGDHFGLAQFIGPEGGQVGVGAAGDGVFGDVQFGVEATGDEVVAGVLGRGGDDEAASVDLGHRVIVRDEGRQGVFIVDDRDHVAAIVVGLFGEAARGRQKDVRHGDRFVWAHGEIHRVAVLAGPDNEFAAQGVEVHFFDSLIRILVQDKGGGQGGVAAEGDFAAGGEPLQVVVAFFALDDEGGFGVVVLDGDGLHQGRVGHFAAGEYACGVAGEEGVREGVRNVLKHKEVRLDFGNQKYEIFLKDKEMPDQVGYDGFDGWIFCRFWWKLLRLQNNNYICPNNLKLP